MALKYGIPISFGTNAILYVFFGAPLEPPGRATATIVVAAIAMSTSAIRPCFFLSIEPPVGVSFPVLSTRVPSPPRSPPPAGEHRRAREQLREPTVRLAPRCPVAGLVHLRRERPADDLARLLERAKLAECHRLHREVPDLRRLRRSSEHGQSRRVRRPLAERPVERAAADDVDLRRDLARRGAEQLDRLPVLEREALEHAADDLARLLRRLLARARAGLADPPRHVPGRQEDGVIRVHERAPRGRRLGERDQLRVLEGLAVVRPRPPALVQEPEADHVLEQAERAAGAALVRQVGVERPLVDHGRDDLDADERPGARADVRGA